MLYCFIYFCQTAAMVVDRWQSAASFMEEDSLVQDIKFVYTKGAVQIFMDMVFGI